jgi:hypothetical protein
VTAAVPGRASPAGIPSELVVRFRRVSPTHHRFEVVRGAAMAGHELETRSTLSHDLVHFALESEAGLRDSFYGRLARGDDYSQLAALAAAGADAAGSDEIWATERIVGPLQGAWRQGFDAARFVASAAAYHAAIGAALPPWLTVELLARVAARLRALEGAWRGTPFGGALDLRFQA